MINEHDCVVLTPELLTYASTKMSAFLVRMPPGWYSGGAGESREKGFVSD
jgi:hypothetical protein